MEREISLCVSRLGKWLEKNDFIAAAYFTSHCHEVMMPA